MKDDIIINKSETIKRCFDRINEEYASDPLNLTNFTKQDSIILNIQRMCESCLDIAMHIISLQRMVGFRNIAVHNYQNLNLDIVQAVIENHIQDPMRFIHVILDY
jgi:uncharacterized protein YutE (UPF0331/DUF86 family)